MKILITKVFGFILVMTLFVTMIVGISWLFDYKPNNLYMVWKFLYNSLLISFLFQLLFGEKITFK